MELTTLKDLGLTTNESKVYLTLIKNGSSLASTIAKKADLHRRPVYESLNRLIKKGLASSSLKSGKKYFQAYNPKILLEKIKEKETNLLQILPKLTLEFNEIKKEIFSEIYEGKQGLTSVMELILKEKSEWLSIGSTGKGSFVLPFYLEHYGRKRAKLKIKRKVLISNTKEGKTLGKKLIKEGLVNIKFLPKNISQPQTIWIFGNKIAIILVSVECPIIFLIENKNISNSFKEYFNILWKVSKE